ncbi:hypothetical protein ABAC460_10145 [Asticcacaulis sp. AC460]|nr:hypothetical protein ABAC460_10145 [Asticcacaulis sp. AC460]
MCLQTMFFWSVIQFWFRLEASMVKILHILFSKCELGLSSDPTQGFKAFANGPLPVFALVVIIGIMCLAFGSLG